MTERKEMTKNFVLYFILAAIAVFTESIPVKITHKFVCLQKSKSFIIYINRYMGSRDSNSKFFNDLLVIILTIVILGIMLIATLAIIVLSLILIVGLIELAFKIFYPKSNLSEDEHKVKRVYIKLTTGYAVSTILLLLSPLLFMIYDWWMFLSYLVSVSTLLIPVALVLTNNETIQKLSKKMVEAQKKYRMLIKFNILLLVIQMFVLLYPYLFLSDDFCTYLNEAIFDVFPNSMIWFPVWEKTSGILSGILFILVSFLLLLAESLLIYQIFIWCKRKVMEKFIESSNSSNI